MWSLNLQAFCTSHKTTQQNKCRTSFSLTHIQTSRPTHGNMQDSCRTVKQSRGIKELCLLKSHWLVSAVINYERQTGWCSQMKQNMFGCAAQPSNDAGKQKDNCPLRWLWKSLWGDVTWRPRCVGGIAKRHRIRQKKRKERKGKKGTWLCTWAGVHLHTIPQPRKTSFFDLAVEAHGRSPVKSVLAGIVELGNW